MRNRADLSQPASAVDASRAAGGEQLGPLCGEAGVAALLGDLALRLLTLAPAALPAHPMRGLYVAAGPGFSHCVAIRAVELRGDRGAACLSRGGFHPPHGGLVASVRTANT